MKSKTEKYYLYCASYKAPKKRKLAWIDVWAKTLEDAIKQLPKEIVRGNEALFLYGIS